MEMCIMHVVDAVGFQEYSDQSISVHTKNNTDME